MMLILCAFCIFCTDRNGRVEIIPNDQGNKITPSVISFTEDGQRLIGDAAKNQLTLNPKNTVFDMKRLIGRKYVVCLLLVSLAHVPIMRLFVCVCV